MLFNRLMQAVNLGKVKDYGVKYNPETNEFESEKQRNVRIYEQVRKDLIEIHVARAPEHGMFSLEQRARIKLA